MIRIGNAAHIGLREVIVRRLTEAAPLGPVTVQMLRSLEGLRTARPRTELMAELQTPPAQFLVSGWAARMRKLPDGRRQILEFLLPGDAIGLSFCEHPRALGSTSALTSVKTLDAAPVQAAMTSADPRWHDLREALHGAACLHEGFLLDQVLRLGRLTAYERMCHLLLELRDRLAAVGLAEGGSFTLNATQEMLADATGLSLVHVNRVLQQMRRDRLLDLHGGAAQFLDLERAAAVCGYVVAPRAPGPNLTP